MQLIRHDVNFDFLGKRFIALAFSTLMLLASIGFLGFQGLNFGIDFTGGTLVEVRFATAPDIGDVRTSLQPAGYSQAVIQEFGSPEEILIRVQNKDDKKSEDISTEILQAIDTAFGKNAAEMRRIEFVGPQVGEELRTAGIMAVFIAMLAILIYVTMRFEFRFALGADAALLHDVLIVLGVFAILGKEFTLPVVAAVLTVIGYSLNDTIVVFDRIRENLDANRRRKKPDDEVKLVNTAINQMLSRTLMTSVTTLLVVFALFFLGGEVIHDFAFALIVGILVGTYSSVYVASPVMMSLHGRFKADEKSLREMEARP
ncbi:MAG: protein translocase subunit SecF [Mariprofundales bacterium]